MAVRRYVALLRGINVGGKNKVAMADLRDVVEAAGYEDVSTYIQSGNVLFGSDAPRDSLEDDLESMLERRFGLSIVVVVRSHVQLRNVVDKAPDKFGNEPDTYHSDVLFLKGSLSSRRVLRTFEPREGVDRVWPGTGVVYVDRVSERRAQSRLSRIVSSPEYERITIRNWKTTTKLLELLEGQT